MRLGNIAASSEYLELTAFEAKFSKDFERWQLDLMHARLMSYYKSGKARGVLTLPGLSIRIQDKTGLSCSRKTVTDFLSKEYFKKADSKVLKYEQALAIGSFLNSPDIRYLKDWELLSINTSCFAPEEFAKCLYKNQYQEDVKKIDIKTIYKTGKIVSDHVISSLVIGKSKGQLSFEIDMYSSEECKNEVVNKYRGYGILLPTLHLHIYMEGGKLPLDEDSSPALSCYISANPIFRERHEYTSSKQLCLLNFSQESDDDFTIDDFGKFNGEKEVYLYHLDDINPLLNNQIDNVNEQFEREALPIFARRKRKSKSRLAGTDSSEKSSSTMDELLKGLSTMSEDDKNKKTLSFWEQTAKDSMLHCYFFSAVQAGNVAGAIEAINDGAPLNEPRRGMTGLHVAALKGDREMVIAILKTGKCDILQRNENGELPAEMAYRYAQDRALGRLLMHLQCKEIKARGLSPDYLNPHYDEQFTPS